MPAVAKPIRCVLRAEGLAVLFLSVLLYWHFSARWLLFLGLLLMPDLAMLPYLLNPRAGATSYNIAHNYVLPLILAAIAVMFHLEYLLPYVFIWTAHIGMDRMLGYGLKYSLGFKETHLSSASM